MKHPFDRCKLLQISSHQTTTIHNTYWIVIRKWNYNVFFLLVLLLTLQYTSCLWCNNEFGVVRSKSLLQNKRTNILSSSSFRTDIKWNTILSRQPASLVVDHMMMISKIDQRYRHHNMILHASGNNYNNDDDDLNQKMEEARIQILKNRRKTIRYVLKTAESFKQYRISTGDAPESDPITGNIITVIDEEKKKNDSKFALSLTAFVVAVGVITLRIGGRTALLSVVGLDFITENNEFKDNLNMILQYTDDMDIILKFLVFLSGWIFIKVLCFDGGAIILALSSGILFGGVIQGAIISALSATIGSYIAFIFAKLDTPIRTKAIELLEEYPSLRGIEKVVSKDGFKAILTLRLAPILPIPIGFYNYIYGITNVPVPAFLSGIFVGSLKPYFLDSYIGYYGKDIIQGNVDSTGGGSIQDFLLLGTLGLSVLIGVFASQLATETWDTVIKEIEDEKKNKKLLLQQQNSTDTSLDVDYDDGLIRKVLGIEVPDWIIGFQLGLKDGQKSITELIESEYYAKVWNYTTDNDIETISCEKNPINYWDSPELQYINNGINLTASLCESLVLTPILFQSFLQYSDPFYNISASSILSDDSEDNKNPPRHVAVIGGIDTIRKRDKLLKKVEQIRNRTIEQINQLRNIK